MFCPYCGKKIPDDSVFCMACGRRMPAVEDAPPAEEVGVATGSEATAKPDVPASKPPKRARRAPAKRRVRKKATPNVLFTAAMSRWLTERGLHVGLPTAPVETANDVKVMQSVLTAAAPLTGLSWAAAIFPHIVGGANVGPEEAAAVLEPFAAESDIIALAPGTNTTLWSIVYADDVRPEVLVQRFERFIAASKSLTKFSIRLFGSASCSFVNVLAVYFDAKAHAAAEPVVLPAAYRETVDWMHAPTLRFAAGLVNVPNATLSWPQGGGAEQAMDSLNRMVGGRLTHLGFDWRPFKEHDLATVIEWAAEMEEL